MKREKLRAAGAPGKAPLLGQRNAGVSSLSRVEYACGMHEALCVYPKASSPSSRTRDNHCLTVFGSLDFQTCRIADSPKSAGREAALEVGLETCAAAVKRRAYSQF